MHNQGVTFARKVPFLKTFHEVPAKIWKAQRGQNHPRETSEATLFIVWKWGGHPINSQVAILLTLQTGKVDILLLSSTYIYMYTHIYTQVVNLR